jgi:hypothetical protein
VLLQAAGFAVLAALSPTALLITAIYLGSVGLTMVVVINAALVWLPFLAYLAAPELTSRRLTAFNAWLLAHGRTVLVLALEVGGAVLAANGILGLVRGG